MTNQILAFYGGDPVVATLLTIAFCALIAAAGVAVNSALVRRQRREEESAREALDRIVAASEPRPWTAPAAKGGEWRDRRVG